MVTISLFSTSVFLLSHKTQVYHFSRFLIYALLYDVFLFLTYFTLYDSHSFLWLSNIPLCVDSLLTQWPYIVSPQRIFSVFMNLSVLEQNHAIYFHFFVLAAPCAWRPLSLPSLLGQSFSCHCLCRLQESPESHNGWSSVWSLSILPSSYLHILDCHLLSGFSGGGIWVFFNCSKKI